MVEASGKEDGYGRRHRDDRWSLREGNKVATWAQVSEGSRWQVKAREQEGGYGRRQRDDRWSLREGNNKAATWAQVSEGSR
jgi:hypothetical protein